jgi:hypothetical protein
MNDLLRDAVVYTLPLYEMARMRAASSPRKNAAGAPADPTGGPESTRRWVNLFGHTRALLGPRDRRVVTPNNDTLYTNAWLDLSRGPLIITTPDTGSRYYVLGFLDFFTNPFAYVGTRTTGNRAQTCWVHGPRWRGTVPPGMTPLACPTEHVWIIGRILATAGEDFAGVHALQDAFRIARAAAPDTPFAGEIIDAGIAPNALPGDATLYARVVNRALAENPPPADEADAVARFAAAGLGAGLMPPGDPRALGQAIQDVLADLDQPRPSRLGGGWTLPVLVRENFGRDYALRALVARGYIGALGIEEAMYPMADVDREGRVLDGRQTYSLRFPPGGLPEVGAFWSLTMYRKADYLLVDNPLERYSIGDRTAGLEHDADGGLTITLSHAQPENAANWLPAPPEPFYVTLRLYLPGRAHLEQRFAYPAIERA